MKKESKTKKPTQTDFGRAFEWAVGCSISKQTGAPIIASPFAKIAESSYEKMNEKTKNSFIKAADIALAHILEKKYPPLPYFVCKHCGARLNIPPEDRN